MWLFDNIFLDQNSPTVMLDPTITEDSEAMISQNTPPEWGGALWVQPNTWANILNSETTSDTQVEGFLSGEDPTATISEDVSFDIGWFDPMESIDSTSSIDEKSIEISNITIDSQTETTESNTGISAVSIALVQWATSAQSDVIMEGIDKTVGSGTVNVAWGIDTATDVIVQEEIQDTITDTVSADPLISTVSDSDMGLMWLFWTNNTEEAQASVVPTVDTESPSSDTIEENNTTIFSPIEPIMSSIITETSDITASHIDTSTDVTQLFAPVAVATWSSESPLHEMLVVFIAKLEKFNSESVTLDTEMVATESSLEQEQVDLKREFDVRMGAIEYKRKHMEQTRADRKIEKTRLERIIANLKREVA